MGWFLLRTDAGVAVRSVADNSDRARLLGIPVRRLSTLVWVIAGLLAGLTGILSAPSSGITIAAGAGPTLILPALAAAIIAGMESLPVAFGAGVALGITSGLFEFNMPRFGSSVGDVVNLVGHPRWACSSCSASGAGPTTPRSPSPRPASSSRSPPCCARCPRSRRAASGSWRWSPSSIVVIPLVSGPGTTLEYTAALIYGIIAISLVVLTGWSGNVSLGQFAFAGVGGVLAGDLIEKSNVDLFLSLAAAGAAGAVLAVVVGIPALRIRGAYLAAVTLALGVAMDTFFLNPTYYPNVIPQAFLRPVLWQRFDLASNKAFYFCCLGLPGPDHPLHPGPAPGPVRAASCWPPGTTRRRLRPCRCRRCAPSWPASCWPAPSPASPVASTPSCWARWASTPSTRPTGWWSSPWR